MVTTLTTSPSDVVPGDAITLALSNAIGPIQRWYVSINGGTEVLFVEDYGPNPTLTAIYTPADLGRYVFTVRGFQTTGAAMGIISTTVSIIDGIRVAVGTVTVKHQLQATYDHATALQWQISTDGITWSDISGAAGPILTIGEWTGEEGQIGTDEPINNAYAVIPAYDQYYRCVAANGTKNAISNVLHVTHAGGAGDPIVSVSP